MGVERFDGDIPEAIIDGEPGGTGEFIACLGPEMIGGGDGAHGDGGL